MLFYVLAGLSMVGAQKTLPSDVVDDHRAGFSNFPNIQYFALGYNGLLSSTTWVGCIYLYADILFNAASAKELPAHVQMVSNLDSNWLYPYEFAGVVFDGSPEESRVAREMLEKAIRVFPNEWRLRVYLAMQMQKQGVAVDSIVRVLENLPYIGEKPAFLNTLMFTLLAKSGESSNAMLRLSMVYQTIRDPFVRLQFQSKIGDLLRRNDVLLGSDSSAFVEGVGSMLDADSSQAASAKDLLIRLVQPETKDAALQEARHLARQFRSYQAAQLGTQR